MHSQCNTVYSNDAKILLISSTLDEDEKLSHQQVDTTRVNIQRSTRSVTAGALIIYYIWCLVIQNLWGCKQTSFNLWLILSRWDVLKNKFWDFWLKKTDIHLPGRNFCPVTGPQSFFPPVHKPQSFPNLNHSLFALTTIFPQHWSYHSYHVQMVSSGISFKE